MADVLAGVSGIHLGEAEAIFLAQKLGTELIVDEREASATAQMFGVRQSMKPLSRLLSLKAVSRSVLSCVGIVVIVSL